MQLLTRKVSRAFIYDIGKKKFLIAKSTLPPFNFHLPGGGIGKKETAEQAVRRELKEELNIGSENIISISFLRKGKTKVLGFPHEMDIFAVSVHDLLIKLSWEIHAIRWVTLEELQAFIDKDCMVEMEELNKFIK
ncbi:MAG: NUDIX hydrolase [Patescibacteria group bacterium]